MRRILVTTLWLLASVSAASAALPPVLEPWRDWVLHDQPEDACPRIGDDEDGVAACRWPGELQLDVDDEAARFAQTWTLHAPQRIPLPGDADARPIDVEVDGRPAPVVLDDEDRPVLALDPGVHRISGRIAWNERPSTLALPRDIAWVSLRLDGETVPLPQRDEDHALVLGATAEAEGDALQIEAYRLLADGVPPWLATRIQLSVAGRPRELLLGPVLPAGYVPLALDGELPMRWEADDRLRVQLRPGDWSLTVIARAPADASDFAAPTVPAPWPAQEFWQFRAAPRFRIAQLEGVAAVDPKQASLPDWEEGLGDEIEERWYDLFRDAESLPAFLFEPGSRATLAVSVRGLPTQRPPRLQLARELWLDFAGDAFIAHDRITGDVGGLDRLDMRAPWQLQQALRDGDESLLVTRGPEAGISGIEWRDSDIELEGGARVDRSTTLPASGWTFTFDAANATLHLPPGYRLLGVSGADQASGSWIEQWNLLDLFLASMVLLLAWRTQPLLVVPLAGWIIWSWHEPEAPQLSLLLLLALTLALRFVPAGRWKRLLRWIQGGTLVLVAIWSLLFAMLQLRLALHPQLERDQVYGAANEVAYLASGGFALNAPPATVEFQSAPPPAPPPPPRSAPQEAGRLGSSASDDTEELDRIEVTGSRIRSMDLFQYPADALPQAGEARPDWQWHRHVLSWSGPLTPDEMVRLWISPPWLTRTLRVLAVLLLGAALALLLRPRRDVGRAHRGNIAAPLLAVFVLAGFDPGVAAAQSIPDPTLLQQLRERLIAHDEPCRPHCAGLGAVSVRSDGLRLRASLDAHAQARLAWPLPRLAEGQQLTEARIDGQPAAVLHDDDGAWVLLERGVHRVELAFASPDGRWRIAFPLAPSSVEVTGDTLEIGGLDEGRLIADTLELTRLVSSQDENGVRVGAPRDEAALPPFVRVRRHLYLDQQWTLRTTVERIAPAHGGVTMPVSLLPGELPLQDAPPQRDGAALVSLAADADEVAWTSRLTPAPEFSLQATNARGYSEEWRILAAPLFRVEMDGVPLAGDEGAGAEAPTFLPLPGETLTIRVTRPEAIAGPTLAIESVSLQTTPGDRARDTRLELTLRSTRAGQHRLPLPVDSELLGIWIDGAEQPRVLDQGAIVLPVRAEKHQIIVTWREPIAIGWRSSTPQVELGAAAANLRLQLTVPPDRWLLATHGPGIGPAVLYWSQLVLLVIVAWLLRRYGGTVLRFHHWLLLGLGFSAVWWMLAAIVAGWLLLLAWRGRRTAPPAGHRFAFLQIAIGFVTLVALVCLVVAIPWGLTGTPDMHVTGNGSWAQQLNWFLDRSEGAVPSASAFTLPLWVYKIAILAWALWLANALLGWLRWGWNCFGMQGRWYWPPRKPRAASAAAATTPAPAQAAAAPNTPESGTS